MKKLIFSLTLLVSSHLRGAETKYFNCTVIDSDSIERILENSGLGKGNFSDYRRDYLRVQGEQLKDYGDAILFSAFGIDAWGDMDKEVEVIVPKDFCDEKINIYLEF